MPIVHNCRRNYTRYMFLTVYLKSYYMIMYIYIITDIYINNIFYLENIQDANVIKCK